jgi:hypothetical protein
VAIFSAVFLINSAGTALFLAVSVLYFTRVVGFSAARLGFGLSAAALIGLAAAVPAGALVDRAGAKKILILAHLVRVAAFSVYPLVHNFAVFVVTAAVIAVADRTAPPASQTLMAEVIPAESRVGVMARLRVWENIGFTAGLGGSALAVWSGSASAYRALIFGNALSFLVVAALVGTLTSTAVAQRKAQGAFAALRTLFGSDRPFLQLTALNGVLALNSSVFAIGVPLWILTRTPLPRWCVPAAMLVNTVLVVFCQVWASRGADSLRQQGRLLMRGGAALGLALVLLALSQGASTAVCAVLLVVAVGVFTFGEMWHSVGGWGVSLGLAPEQARGRYLAVFGLGLGAQEVAGPTVAALLVAHGRAGLIVCAGVLLAAGVAADAVVRNVSDRALPAPTEPVAETA